MSTSYSRTGWREPPKQHGPIHYDPAELIPARRRHDRVSRLFACAAIALAALVFGGQMLRGLLG